MTACRGGCRARERPDGNFQGGSAGVVSSAAHPRRIACERRPPRRSDRDGRGALRHGRPGSREPLSAQPLAGRLCGTDRSHGAQSATSESLKRLRERLTDRAVATLARAAKAGLPHLNRLEVDAFLDPIRNCEGYRKLNESLRMAGSGSDTSPSRDDRSATTRTQRP